MRRKFIVGAIAATILAEPSVAQPGSEVDPADWPRYARDMGGTRYSPLEEIDTSNVGELEEAWSFRLRPQGGAALLGGTVPIVIDGRMYLPLGNAVVAIEGHTGRELWRHEVTSGLVRRGVSYWAGEGEQAPRIFYSTGNGLVALNAASGEVDTAFGEGGSIAFDGAPYPYPPSIYGNVMVIGANTPEVSKGPVGDSRAFDARTGEMLWRFRTVPGPGETGHETWLDEGWKDRPGANMWIWYTTADPDTNTLYMTLGSPGPNYWGGDRPGANLFGNSLVAVDIETGEYKWHFQAIHHDLWDWDQPAPPVLFDVEQDGEKIPALALTGKPGLMYILDRRTGEPVHGVNEHFVAAANVPGEYYHPTQPIPVKPEPLNRMRWTPEDVVTAEDTTAEHAAACRELLASYGGTFFNAGPFTPFFLREEGDPPHASINMPHNGGSNWGGAASDPASGIVYINTSESGSIGWIEPRDPEGDYGRGTADSDQPYDRGSLIGPGAYSSFSASYETEDGESVNLPCIRPPWGRLIAVDGNTGDIRWAVPLGTTPQLAEDKRETGANNTFGGPIATAGGLVFIGATSDRFFRAFDARTGRILWQRQLDYGALTVPVTYRGADGRQYVAVVASGSAFGGPVPRGADGRPFNNEALVAFALPE